MRVVFHRRELGGRAAPVRGRLPRFSMSIGLDVIITSEDRPYLIELQHGFGRRGLHELFPQASRAYRRSYWALRRICGKSPFLSQEMHRISSDKICTYRHLARYQPRSFVFSKGGPDLERWLHDLPSDLLLLKPPRGSCGEGILVLDRRSFVEGHRIAKSGAVLLQEFVRSRSLVDDEGRPHVGCIRHIVLLSSEDGAHLCFSHLPGYWRVSPKAVFATDTDKDALTANISRGAYPLAVDERDTRMVQNLSEEVITLLLKRILGLSALPSGGSRLISQ